MDESVSAESIVFDMSVVRSLLKKPTAIGKQN